MQTLENIVPEWIRHQGKRFTSYFDPTRFRVDAFRENPNLDFLRSSAVLFVVGFHLLYLFEHRHSRYASRLRFFHSIGHWGVLIFFVHTSLVLMSSFERQQLRFPGKPSYTPFLIRRVFRIYPLSIAIVLLVTFLKLPMAQLADAKFMAAHVGWGGILSNLLLLQNLTHTDSVIIPLWSLPYEMQMYLLLPPLFLLVRSKRYFWSIPLLWAAAAFFGSHGSWLERNGIPDFVIYIPCFLSGIVAYKLTKTWSLQLPAFLWPPTLAALTLFYLKSPTYQHAWYSCLMLGLAIPQFQEMTNPISRKTFQVIARYSYGIYLVHFICIWLAFQAIGGMPGWLSWEILLITVSVFPYFLYHLLEKPMMRLGESAAGSLRGWLESQLSWGTAVEGAIDW
jgi:peptidoglycan/LPS O-acetylase OafA/YrhL